MRMSGAEGGFIIRIRAQKRQEKCTKREEVVRPHGADRHIKPLACPQGPASLRKEGVNTLLRLEHLVDIIDSQIADGALLLCEFLGAVFAQTQVATRDTNHLWHLF